MKTFDQIWLRIVKVIGFGLGCYIMYHEAIFDHSERPYLYAAALAMMGSQIGETFGKIADGVSSVMAAFSTRRVDGSSKETNQIGKGE